MAGISTTDLNCVTFPASVVSPGLTSTYVEYHGGLFGLLRCPKIKFCLPIALKLLLYGSNFYMYKDY